MYFQVAPKITSVECLNAIKTFLISLKSMKTPSQHKFNCSVSRKAGVNNIELYPKESKILPLNVVSTINNKSNVMSLVVSSVDALYYYLLPLLDKSKMYTFKFMDFKS